MGGLFCFTPHTRYTHHTINHPAAAMYCAAPAARLPQLLGSAVPALAISGLPRATCYLPCFFFAKTWPSSLAAATAAGPHRARRSLLRASYCNMPVCRFNKHTINGVAAFRRTFVTSSSATGTTTLLLRFTPPWLSPPRTVLPPILHYYLLAAPRQRI